MAQTCKQQLLNNIIKSRNENRLKGSNQGTWISYITEMANHVQFHVKFETRRVRYLVRNIYVRVVTVVSPFVRSWQATHLLVVGH